MAAGSSLKSNSPVAGGHAVGGCTIICADELPNAAVLANSFRRFHPDAAFTVLILDELGRQTRISNTKIVSLADLGLESAEQWRLPMLFSRRALRTYLKPLLLAKLSRAAPSVLCFSPFTQIFDKLSDVFEMVRTTSAISATEPIQNEWGDGGGSFVGVPSPIASLLEEWFERIRAADPANEKAIESVFDAVSHRMIQAPGFAVHYSNLNPASLTGVDRGYRIGGQPLRSFDFRGYDPDKPHLLSRYLGPNPRILLSEFPVIAALCDAYRQQLLDAGHARGSSAGPRFEFLTSGLPIDLRMRRVYREGLAKFKSGQSSEPPSPFGPGGEQGFVNWLNEPIDEAGKGVTRYMLAVYEDRPDVKTAFPDPTHGDAAAFRHWYLTYGTKELNLPADLVPSRKSVSITDPAKRPVNVAGYFRAELGLGTAARSLVASLEAAGLPITTVTFDGTANRLAHPFAERSGDRGAADINIVCINPDQIAAFAEQAGPEFWHGRYNIAVWFWEVEDFPMSFHHAFNYVDEIWVASEFMRRTFLKVSPKPVFKFRLPVLAPTIDKSLTRTQLRLPEQFTFLFSFDFFSVLERKNPLGLIEAFTKAFAPSEGPRLVIKTINGDKCTTEMEKLKYAIRGRPDIVLMDEYLSAVENATFTGLSDCYVSLHRSEGFGLTIAEAMALGKPAIATDYSGNLEFMTLQNSYLCPARRCEVGPEREPYPAATHWSEPDVAAAAGLLRHVYKHRAEASAKGARAAEHIASQHSAPVAGKIMSGRLATIRQRHAKRGPAPSIALLQDRLDELERRLST
jgi:glycosyltransferase involved in cell wall biosynthesis